MCLIMVPKQTRKQILDPPSLPLTGNVLGEYVLDTWANLNGGESWAIQLDGIIYRTGRNGGNMIGIKRAKDFELFSSNGKGVIQANG
ncbi:hypothetical protein BDA99DRAFT_353635 [Phascolomyces articulosus]|uniref:Uncharacterized protein n=1 Tax=Phascolomyces articulosus TaxID=60185 RepID=A0AAD5KDF2_9FUNG|nr:hypothetical protein BDA99DRAFT_353635 [Phascolomyces articulosus]